MLLTEVHPCTEIVVVTLSSGPKGTVKVPSLRERTCPDLGPLTLTFRYFPFTLSPLVSSLCVLRVQDDCSTLKDSGSEVSFSLTRPSNSVPTTLRLFLGLGKLKRSVIYCTK